MSPSLQIKNLKMATTPNEKKITHAFDAPSKFVETHHHTPLRPILFDLGDVISVLDLLPPAINNKELKAPETPFTVHCKLNGPEKKKECPTLQRREEKIVMYDSPPIIRKRSSDEITPQGEQKWNTDENNSTLVVNLKSLLKGFFLKGPTSDQKKRLKQLHYSYKN